MFQRIELVGRLGKDPETRYTGSGAAVTNFSVATDRSWKDRNSGEWQKKTTWWKLVAWQKLAEYIQSKAQKGTLVYVSGTGEEREWKDKEGQKRTSFEVLVNEIRFLKDYKATESKSNGDDFNGGGAPINDEDIPF